MAGQKKPISPEFITSDSETQLEDLTTTTAAAATTTKDSQSSGGIGQETEAPPKASQAERGKGRKNGGRRKGKEGKTDSASQSFSLLHSGD